MLPIDVLACHVFPYLSIEDIMSLRRVRRHLSYASDDLTLMFI